MPLHFLREGRGRTALTVAGIATAVAFVCAVDAVSGALVTAFADVVDVMAGRAALEVRAGPSGLVPEGVADTAAKVPGVERAVPVVSATAFVADGGEVLTVHGIDLTDERAVRTYEASDDAGAAVDDVLVFLSQPDSVIATRTFAARRGLQVGDALVLDTPRGRKRFTVRGLLEPTGLGRVYGGNLLVLDLFAAEAAFGEPGFVSRIDIVPERGSSVDEIGRRLRETLPAGLTVETPAQRKVDLGAVVGSIQALLRGAGLVTLVAAFLVAFSCLSSRFEARAWQLGVLAAIGVRAARIRRELLAESLLLGALGVGLGIPLGLLLARPLLPVIATATALNFKVLPPETTIFPSAGSLVLGCLLGLGAALLAALLPARRAVRLGIAEVLRHQGEEQERTGVRRVAVFAALLAGAALLSIALEWTTRWPAFGLAATLLIVLCAAVAAAPFSSAALRLIAPAVRWVGGRCGRLAEASLRRNPRRAALAISMLGVGLGAVVWLWTLAQSFEQSVVEALSRAMRADLVVSSSNIASGFLEAPLDGEVATRLAAIPDVAAVAAWRAFEWPYQGAPIGISAYDPIYFRNRGFGDWALTRQAIADPWEAVARGEGVVVSTGFVTNLGLGAGDRLRLDTPSGPLDLPIVGVTVDFVSPRGTVEISRDLVERYWYDHTLTRAFVLAAPAGDVPGLRARIAHELGRTYGIRILSAGELLGYFRDQVRRAFSVIPILAGLVMVVILVGIAETLVASILLRTNELAVARVSGARRSWVSRMVFAEGLALGGVGVLLASIVGLGLGALWVGTTFTDLLGWKLEFHLPVAQLGAIAAAALLTCGLGAWIPARRAASVEPAEAQRAE